jgi:murein DD-endopeptidase
MSPADLIANARRFLGCPYVWQGKGKSLWTPRGLELHPWVGQVFDCSGLVTCALKLAGGPDLRATHNAQTMFDTFAAAADESVPGTLRFYGTSRRTISHVAILTEMREGFAWVIEAAGGDHTTTSPLIAANRKACVREGRQLRLDYVGSRVAP